MAKSRSLSSAKSFGQRIGLEARQSAKLARLTTPERVQDFINTIPINFEPEGDTCHSAAVALKRNRAHCIEASFIAACALWMQGEKPLLLDLKAKGDDDHVVTLFKKHGCWGAISKTNHVWLRWRDPIYRTVRELALSYFHEYVSKRSKTLWSYSTPFDLSRFDPAQWVTGDDGCWEIATALDESRHFSLITRRQADGLRARDPIEIEAGKLLEFKVPKPKAARY